jgi:hypothetical protein
MTKDQKIIKGKLGLLELAKHLTFIEQIEEDIARGKTRPARDFKAPN